VEGERHVPGGASLAHQDGWADQQGHTFHGSRRHRHCRNVHNHGHLRRISPAAFVFIHVSAIAFPPQDDFFRCPRGHCSGLYLCSTVQLSGPAAMRKFKFIGCEIIRREACLLAARCPHKVDLEFLLKGLHDLETSEMLAKVQAGVDCVDSQAGYEAVLLGYARCNDGVAGLTAREIPLVIPRAHDCITFFFGSNAAYREHFDAFPGTYYMTTGWTEVGEDEGRLARPAYGTEGVMGKLGLTDSYEQMVARYGRENADFIRQTLGDWTRNYSKMMYIDMEVCDEEPYIARARQIAAERNWSFELRKGNWSLLERLFSGQWDDDFLVVRPGEHIEPRNDDRIMEATR
jgi:hypothetical protein